MKDPTMRIAVVSAWMTAAFVTLWSLSEGFRHAVQVKGPEDEPPTSDE